MWKLCNNGVAAHVDNFAEDLDLRCQLGDKNVNVR